MPDRLAVCILYYVCIEALANHRRRVRERIATSRCWDRVYSIYTTAAGGSRCVKLQDPARLPSLRGVVNTQTEDVVGAEERASQRLQDEHLRVGVRWVIVALQST